MKCDLFHELSVPPFGGRSEAQVFTDTLEELTLADTLGFTTAWLVEHHFMPEYSHSSAPEMFLSAVGQRTRRMRLGHAIVPLPYHHPVRVAERLATLDILTGGRVEFGFGRGFSPAEYGVFGVDMADSRSLTEEALAVILRCFEPGPVSFEGRHFRFDNLEVVPGVVQSPHPPIWTAAVSPESFDLAARLGVGALVGPFKPWFMVREDIRRYRRAWREHQGDGAPHAGHNNRVAMTVAILCMEDGAQARRAAREPFEWFYRRLLGQTRPVLEKLYETYEYYRRLGRFRGFLDHAVNLKLLDTLGMAVVGDPDHCAARLRTLAEEGVDHVLCAFGAGAMDTHAVRQSMALFAREVMPRLTEGD